MRLHGVRGGDLHFGVQLYAAGLRRRLPQRSRKKDAAGAEPCFGACECDCTMQLGQEGVQSLHYFYATELFSVSILYAALLYTVAAVHNPGSRHHGRCNVRFLKCHQDVGNSQHGREFAIRRWAG